MIEVNEVNTGLRSIIGLPIIPSPLVIIMFSPPINSTVAKVNGLVFVETIKLVAFKLLKLNKESVSWKSIIPVGGVTVPLVIMIEASLLSAVNCVILLAPPPNGMIRHVPLAVPLLIKYNSTIFPDSKLTSIVLVSFAVISTEKPDTLFNTKF